jgi:hypothetical protein
MADKINGGIFYQSVRYGPGDEQKLREANIDGRTLQGWRVATTNSNQPLIEGFDDLLGRKVKRVTPSGLGVDATVAAGPEDQAHYVHGQRMQPVTLRDASDEDDEDDEPRPKGRGVTADTVNRGNPPPRVRTVGHTAGDDDEDDGIDPRDPAGQGAGVDDDDEDFSDDGDGNDAGAGAGGEATDKRGTGSKGKGKGAQTSAQKKKAAAEKKRRAEAKKKKAAEATAE